MKTDPDQVRLDRLAKRIRVCTKCPLSESRTHAVPGDGTHSAKLMIIGEAPGQAEDECGHPFAGLAGRWLTKLLEEAGFERDDCFITNTVKCRPPRNRTPKKIEVETCTASYLFEQIKRVDPKLIMLLGSVAAKALLGIQSVRAARGRVIEYEGRKYLVGFHPIAAVPRKDLKADFAFLKRELRDL